MIPKQPHIIRLYRQFLQNEDSAEFVSSIAKLYTIPTLHRLASGGDRITRRASVLALTYLGGQESFDVLGRALRDKDRAVRLLAGDGIRPVWSRSHGKALEMELGLISRLLLAAQFEKAAEQATRLIEAAPSFAEAWNKRAIALFEMESTYESIADCQRVLELNPHHFPAATGLGHCFMDLEETAKAIEYFRYALSVSPDLEYVRNQLDILQRSTDS